MPKQNDRLSWEEPPQVEAYARSNYDVIARKLKARKGEWAKIQKHDTPAKAAAGAHLVRIARSRFFAPAGSFEAKARTVDGECWVFARYVGEGEESERSAPTAPGGA